ncbi:hypothetical protein [Brevundimonas sp.]|uniref:hypothetical protein n=1 Tax=Brevundimonas sp. TaxID=1871086 RepID=UPI003510F6AC
MTTNVRARDLAFGWVPLLRRFPHLLLVLACGYCAIRLAYPAFVTILAASGHDDAVVDLLKGRLDTFEGPNGLDRLSVARDQLFVQLPLFALSLWYVRMSVLSLVLRGKLVKWFGVGFGVREWHVAFAMALRLAIILPLAALPLIVPAIAGAYYGYPVPEEGDPELMIMAAFLIPTMIFAWAIYSITSPLLPAIYREGAPGWRNGLKLGWEWRNRLLRAHLITLPLALAVWITVEVLKHFFIAPDIPLPGDLPTLNSFLERDTLLAALAASVVALVYDVLWAVPGATLVARLAQESSDTEGSQ